jgi:hypothetical protein
MADLCVPKPAISRNLCPSSCDVYIRTIYSCTGDDLLSGQNENERLNYRLWHLPLLVIFDM